MWFKNFTIEDLHQSAKGTMMEHIGIEFTDIGEDYLAAKMPVDHRTTQPAGLLHGGASVALAESLGSMAAYRCLDPEKLYCVGLEINANHIRSVKDGYVHGIAKPLHMGRNTHIWEIKITDQDKKLICVSRLTMAIISKERVK